MSICRWLICVYLGEANTLVRVAGMCVLVSVSLQCRGLMCMHLCTGEFTVALSAIENVETW